MTSPAYHMPHEIHMIREERASLERGEYDHDPERKAKVDAWLERSAPRERAYELRDAGITLTPTDLAMVCERRLEQTRAIRTVDRWLEQDDRLWLVLCGGVGTGKTLAGAHALATLGGRCIRAHRLAEAMFPGYGADDHGNPDTGRPLGMLDDLGTEDASPRFHAALADWLERRHGGRSIITSNLPPGELAARYGARFADRVNHLAAVIELKGDSLRRQDGGLG